MFSSRIILAFLGVVFVIIVLISSGKILNNLRGKISFLPQKSTVESTTISVTPTVTGTATQEEVSPTETGYQETPATGPGISFYLLTGGAIISGAILKKIKLS